MLNTDLWGAGPGSKHAWGRGGPCRPSKYPGGFASEAARVNCTASPGLFQREALEASTFSPTQSIWGFPRHLGVGLWEAVGRSAPKVIRKQKRGRGGEHVRSKQRLQQTKLREGVTVMSWGGEQAAAWDPADPTLPLGPLGCPLHPRLCLALEDAGCLWWP